MNQRILVIAPHPDDETLGCGGTLLRSLHQGAELGWLIVTGIAEETGFTPEQVKERDWEINKLAELYRFSQVFNLRLPTRRLDAFPMAELIDHFSSAFKSFEPEVVYLPSRSDVHTDHRVVFDAASACVKWFRYPSVRRVLAYETLSETELALDSHSAFRPNYFVDVSGYLERKIEIMSVYRSELGIFPFPRSLEAIRALAVLRGATAGFHAAEAFELLRELY